MVKTKVQILEFGMPFPKTEKPFAVLLDANDAEWADKPNADQLIRKLLVAGGRFFVCYGPGGNTLHNLIDDVAFENDYHDIITTCHEKEAKEEVAIFFRTGAMIGMNGALALVSNLAGWKTLLEIT